MHRAEIVNIPFCVIREASDLPESFHRGVGCSGIAIDRPGHSILPREKNGESLPNS